MPVYLPKIMSWNNEPFHVAVKVFDRAKPSKFVPNLPYIVNPSRVNRNCVELLDRL